MYLVHVSVCSILLVLPVLGYVDQMSEEDMAYMEKHFPRSKRDVGAGLNLRLPFDFKKLPRLDVVTVEHKPFTFIEYPDCKEADKTKCKAKYRGFMVDLMYVIGRRLGTFIRFYQPADGRWGSKETNGSWNGMMGEVIKRELSLNDSQAHVGNVPIGSLGADIAAAPLTITALREADVDFIKPFAHLGLTVLVKRPVFKSDWPFNFDILKPLTPAVWGSAVVAMFVVWAFIWLMNRYNPYEYGERKRRNLATEEESSLFNVTGSFWFMFTILMWQGYDRSPRCVASKVMGCFWMAFVTLFLVVYIGSYVNHLFWASTVHGDNPTEPVVNSLADLVMHKDKYEYGTIADSNTYRYLTEVASGEEFKLMKQYFEDPHNKKQLVSTFEEGVAKVRAGKFGFICESMLARYIVNTRPCDLTTVESFGARSYGLALPWNTFIDKEKLHAIVLEMIEEGDIEALEKKWFELKGECWNVTVLEHVFKKTSELLVNQPKRVSLDMFWSAIVLLIVGSVLSLIVAVAEILWFKYRGRYAASNRQRTQQLTNEDDGHI